MSSGGFLLEAAGGASLARQLRVDAVSRNSFSVPPHAWGGGCSLGSVLPNRWFGLGLVPKFPSHGSAEPAPMAFRADERMTRDRITLCGQSSGFAV